MHYPTLLSISKKRGVTTAFKALIFLGMILVSPFHTHAAVLYTNGDQTHSQSYTFFGPTSTFTYTGPTQQVKSISVEVSNTLFSGGNASGVELQINSAGGHSCLYNDNIDHSLGMTTNGSSLVFYTSTQPLTENVSGDCTLVNGNSYTFAIYFPHGAGQTISSNQDVSANLYFILNSTLLDTTTHIVDFTPEDGASVSNPVTFSIHGYVNPADLGNAVVGIDFTLHNIDQNVLLLGAFSPSDIYILRNTLATTSGDFYYSTTTYIGTGNYRLEASLQRSYLSGWIVNPFSPIDSDMSHQFVVGSSTFIGSIQQNMFNDIFGAHGSASSSPTSTAALLAGCNPLGAFNVVNCTSAMFVPDPVQIQSLVLNFQQGVASHAPWGYVQRLFQIMTSSTTAALPTFTASIPTGPGDKPFVYSTVTFDPGEMLASGGALLDSVRDPVDNKSVRDVFYPWVQGSVALVVLLTIAADVMGSHRHDTGEVKSKKT